MESQRGGDRVGGLLDSLRALGATAASIARTRLELLLTELEEERTRLGSLVIVSIAAVFCMGMAILLATLLIVVFFWDTHRLRSIGLLVLLYFVVGAVCAVVAAKRSRQRPKLFSASLAEISKDEKALSSRQ
jgi:uncharacterized membrane protein YqjE